LIQEVRHGGRFSMAEEDAGFAGRADTALPALAAGSRRHATKGALAGAHPPYRPGKLL